ncbi:hypothetical protein PSD17_39420 [Pseudonocardia sp. D17]|nr:hypothetical protein PSD17_39420 [Pseudonocardia sp. D17]
MLDDLYGQLPAIECKGLCHDTCTSIDASELERRRIAAAGVNLPDEPAADRVARLRPDAHGLVDVARARPEDRRCPALGPLNNCTVYEVRPFVCRAFGLVHQRENPLPHTGPMMCDHGCIPDGTISLAEFGRIVVAIERLSQEVTGVARLPL